MSAIGPRTSRHRDEQARQQVIATSAWAASRMDVRKAVVPSSESDIKRVAYHESPAILGEFANKSDADKEALIIKADLLGKPLIDAFIRETKTWSQLEKRADDVAGLHLEIGSLKGCTDGLPTRVVDLVKRAFKKAPVLQTPIPMGTLLDVAAYISAERLTRHDGQDAGPAHNLIEIVASQVEKALDKRDANHNTCAEKAKILADARDQAAKILADARAQATALAALAALPQAASTSAAQNRQARPLLTPQEKLFVVPTKRRSTVPSESSGFGHLAAMNAVPEPNTLTVGAHVLIPRYPDYPMLIKDDQCMVDSYRGQLHEESWIHGEWGWTIKWFPIKVTQTGTEPWILEPVLDQHNILTVTKLKPYLCPAVSPDVYHKELMELHNNTRGERDAQERAQVKWLKQQNKKPHSTKMKQ